MVSSFRETGQAPEWWQELVLYLGSVQNGSSWGLGAGPPGFLAWCYHALGDFLKLRAPPLQKGNEEGSRPKQGPCAESSTRSHVLRGHHQALPEPLAGLLPLQEYGLRATSAAWHGTPCGWLPPATLTLSKICPQTS